MERLCFLSVLSFTAEQQRSRSQTDRDVTSTVRVFDGYTGMQSQHRPKPLHARNPFFAPGFVAENQIPSVGLQFPDTRCLPGETAEGAPTNSNDDAEALACCEVSSVPTSSQTQAPFAGRTK